MSVCLSLCLSDGYRRPNYPVDWGQTAFRCQVGPDDRFSPGPILIGHELAARFGPFWPVRSRLCDSLGLWLKPDKRGINHCQRQRVTGVGDGTAVISVRH